MSTPTLNSNGNNNNNNNATVTTQQQQQQQQQQQKTPTESDVYDRQIRLWGAESQQKMMKSKVLYIHITGVTAEVLKNLALAGIHATLCDGRPAADMAPHFLTPTGPVTKRTKYASVAHAVQPLVEDMNPLLGGCPILETPVEELTEEDLAPFTVIVASQIPLMEAVRLSQLATKRKSHFYLADCFGWNGACLMDLGKDLTFRPEQGKRLLDPQPLKDYTSLEEMVQAPLKDCINRFHKTPPPVYLQYRCLLEYQAQKGHFPSPNNDNDNEETTFDDSIWPAYLNEQEVELSTETLTALQTAGMAQVAPVCAVLGGMLGNEVIKVVSGKGEPSNNTILLDGKACKAWTFLVQPKKSP